MDMIKTVQEIGLVQTAINLAKVCGSSEVLDEVGTSMPMPNPDIETAVPVIAEWLHDFGKSKYLFLTPEIALIEELGKYADSRDEAIIAIPGDMDSDMQLRIKNNIPHNIKVTIQTEYAIPRAFYPENSLMVVCGYTAGGRLMVLPETYRLIVRNSDFLGKKVFIPYQDLEIAVRYDNWMEASRNNISVKWRAVS